MASYGIETAVGYGKTAYMGFNLTTIRWSPSSALIRIPIDVTVINMRAYIYSNTLNGDTRIQVYDDATYITFITVPAGTTGFFDSGTTSWSVAAESNIMIVIRAGGTTGNIYPYSICTEFRS